MTCTKHKLKFVQVGYGTFVYEGPVYFNLTTWDFQCVKCPTTHRVDRQAWRNKLIGHASVPQWIL